jgi:hypothetical protein
MAEGRPPDKEYIQSLQLPEIVNERSIDGLEKQAMENANKTITELDKVLAAWDASKEKPEEYAPRIKKYRWLLDALSGWERAMLLSLKTKPKFEERVKMLERFVDIYSAFQGA